MAQEKGFRKYGWVILPVLLVLLMAGRICQGGDFCRAICPGGKKGFGCGK